MNKRCKTVEVLQVKPGEIVRIGNSIYGICFDCRKFVKLSGFWKGVHICR